MKRTKTNKTNQRADNAQIYGDDTPIRAYKLSLLGLTDEQMGVALGVSRQCIDNWKRIHPEFSQAINKGKDEADANVARSLYQRALGFSHPDTHIAVTRDKKSGAVEVVKTPVIKHYPPDTTACIFWLKNRQRENWSDTQRIDINGTVKHTDLSDLTDEELNFLSKIGLKKDLSEML